MMWSRIPERADIMCKIYAKTKDLPKEEWLKLRKNGIGGSDAGAVCGVNPYRSALDVFVDKTTDSISDFDNEAMRQGRDLEDYVAQRFCEETGLKVRRSNAMYVNEKYPFMLADVDRLIIGENAGLECKTASPYSYDKWQDGKIPAHYLAQCYHYMAVIGMDAWYLAVVIYGKEFKYIKLERDNEIIDNLIRIEKQFWEENVLKGIMPAPDGSRSADEFIKEHFADSCEGKSVPLVGFDTQLKRRQEIDELLDKLNTEKNAIDQQIKTYMKDAEISENQSFIVSWKNVISNKIDTAKLKLEMPDIYRQFLKPSNSRRFTVKTV